MTAKRQVPVWAMALGVLAVMAAVLVALGSLGGDPLPASSASSD